LRRSGKTIKLGMSAGSPTGARLDSWSSPGYFPGSMLQAPRSTYAC
jgi:hypothetical protein